MAGMRALNAWPWKFQHWACSCLQYLGVIFEVRCVTQQCMLSSSIVPCVCRYVGGETRLVGLQRTNSYSAFLQQLSKASSAVWDEVSQPGASMQAAGLQPFGQPVRHRGTTLQMAAAERQFASLGDACSAFAATCCGTPNSPHGVAAQQLCCPAKA